MAHRCRQAPPSASAGCPVRSCTRRPARCADHSRRVAGPPELGDYSADGWMAGRPPHRLPCGQRRLGGHQGKESLMEAFVVFKYLHVVTMFFAIALAVSTELVVRRVAMSRDPGAISTAIARSRALSNLSSVLFLAGIAFGIIAALTGNMDLLAPWLVLSYVAV